MANRTITLLNAVAVVGAGTGQLVDLVRDGNGAFCVEFAGTLGTFTVILEGRPTPGSGEWMKIAQFTQADTDFVAGYKGDAVAVTLLPEMRANCTVHSGGAMTSITAKLVQ